MLAGLLVLIPVGCGRVARHKILTFFFEGVPPLDGDPNAGKRRTGVTQQTNLRATERAVKVVKKSSSSRHEPAADCGKCHRSTTVWDDFVKPLPDLCYSCHTDYRASGGYLHGPVSVGACMFCHDAHQSKYMHLQKEPQPELCFQCHMRQDIESIAGHQDSASVSCTKCHNPHIGPTRKLLRSPQESRDDHNAVDIE